MSDLPRKFEMPDFPDLTPEQKVDRFLNIHLEAYDLPGVTIQNAETLILCGMYTMALVLRETFRFNPEMSAGEIDDFTGACLSRLTKVRKPGESY